MLIICYCLALLKKIHINLQLANPKSLSTTCLSSDKKHFDQSIHYTSAPKAGSNFIYSTTFCCHFWRQVVHHGGALHQTQEGFSKAARSFCLSSDSSSPVHNDAAANHLHSTPSSHNQSIPHFLRTFERPESLPSASAMQSIFKAPSGLGFHNHAPTRHSNFVAWTILAKTSENRSQDPWLCLFFRHHPFNQLDRPLTTLSRFSSGLHLNAQLALTVR